MQSATIICCSVLRMEVEDILRRELPDIEAIFLDSMLHMHPERLHRVMDESLATLGNRNCLLIYGDCHPHICDTDKRPHCSRTKAVNCTELLMGEELYRRYRRRKAFVFLPEWTLRWREVFLDELGFREPSLAREFMQENRSVLVYIDTGIIPVPQKVLDEIADFFAMPVEVLAVSLDSLRRAIDTALAKFAERRPDNVA
ncbi:MAG: DUF1638 domain-containing protein [Desulforhopalus sp.]|nr:DUF1638 domain-containing protein [Desulforhopalus sp.]